MARVPVVNRNSPGVVLDLPGVALPPEAFTAATNVVFRNGLAERVGGRAALGPVISPTPFQVATFKPYNLDHIAYFLGETKITVSDGTTETDVTGSTVPSAVLPNDWTITNFNGIPVFNQPNMVPQQADFPGINPITDPLIDLPAWDPTWLTNSLRTFKNVLVAIGMIEGGTPYPNVVRTSSVTDPGAVPASWDHADPATLATRTPLPSTDDEDDTSVIDGRQLKDIFVIYKRTNATVMAIGGQNIYTFNRTFSKGVFNRNCIVEPVLRETRHLVVGLDDIYLHNGYTEESIIEDKLRETLFASIDPTHSYLVHAAHDAKRGLIFVPYPSIGASLCDHAWVWNYKRNQQSIVELDPTYSLFSGPFTATIPGADTWESDELGWEDDEVLWGDTPATALRPRLIQAAADGLFVLGEAAPDRAALIERTGLALAGRAADGSPIWDTESVKNVTGMWPRFIGTGMVNFYLGTSDNPNEAITWGQARPFNMSSWARVDCYGAGRILHVRFEATDTSQWRFLGYDLEITTVGE